LKSSRIGLFSVSFRFDAPAVVMRGLERQLSIARGGTGPDQPVDLRAA
jgi:hypothetical protein